MRNEFFSSTKRIIIKIIPHHSTSVYRLEVSHRHAAVIGIGALVIAASLITFQIGAVNAANTQVRRLQAADAQQRRQLQAFSDQTHAMMSKLEVLDHRETEIRKLTGIAGPGKQPPVKNVVAPKSGGVADRGARQTSSMLPRRGPTGPLAFFSRVRALLAGNEPPLTFATESAALTVLDLRLEQALADSNDLEHKATVVAQAKRAAALARQRYLDAIPSLWPTDGYVTSGFGYRTYPDAEFHEGLDIVNDYGSPVYATAAGVVVESGWDAGYGYKIIIDHGNGFQTWYAHNSRNLVDAGETVRKGEEIARVGESGFATGPHVHYQLEQFGRPIDPTPYLSGIPAQYTR